MERQDDRPARLCRGPHDALTTALNDAATQRRRAIDDGDARSGRRLELNTLARAHDADGSLAASESGCQTLGIALY